MLKTKEHERDKTRKENTMYMSYCRFEGTRHELGACIGEVYDHINEEAEYEVSENEIQNFRQMVESFVELLNDAEILTEYGEINEEALDQVCEKMAKSFGEEDYE